MATFISKGFYGNSRYHPAERTYYNYRFNIGDTIVFIEDPVFAEECKAFITGLSFGMYYIAMKQLRLGQVSSDRIVGCRMVLVEKTSCFPSISDMTFDFEQKNQKVTAR